MAEIVDLMMYVYTHTTVGVKLLLSHSSCISQLTSTYLSVF
jgi:hypothetical protein